LQIQNINLKINNNIKLEGGLGSSSSEISGGLFAANYYLKEKYLKLDLIKLFQELEKDYENIFLCIMGGIKICVKNENEVLLLNVD
jgi:Homoserine kinase